MTSNLRQWGIGVAAYAGENNQQLLASASWAGVQSYRLPLAVWLAKSPSAPGEFNTVDMSAYLPGVDSTNHRMRGVWVCPSSNLAVWDTYTQNYWGGGFFGITYSYFARFDNTWSATAASAAAIPMLTGKELDPDRVLITDYLFDWTFGGASGGWGYSHGPSGPHLHDGTQPGGNPDPGPPAFDGLNEGYGDGHVTWKSSAQFNVAGLQADDPTLSWVYGDGLYLDRTAF